MKLKHRITGTILMIAFAITTALPAATIPQLKNPPKAVAKVPSAPVAPRIPVVPKVNIPAVPKVPTVKVPVTPRIVAAPKIPVVKAAPKIPSTPKVVSTPKVPVVKARVIVKAPAAAPKVVKSPVTAPSRPVANLKVNPNDIRKVVNEALKPSLITRSQDFATQPSRSLPGSNKPNLKPTSPGTPSLDGDSGTATPTIGGRPIPTLNPFEGKPAFDNGFGDAPQINEADVAGVLTLNPMKGQKGGPASNGPLGTSEVGGNPSNGPAGQGTSLISDGAQDEPMPQGDADQDDEPLPAGDGEPEIMHAYTDKDGNTVEVSAEGEILTTRPDGSTVSHGKDSTSYKSADGRSWVLEDNKGNKTVFRDGQKVGTIDSNGNITPSQPAGQPDPENRYRGNHTFGTAVGQQLKQGKSGRKNALGGGADVTPVNESLMGGSVRIPGAAVPQNKIGMVGNPGQQGGPEKGGPTPPPNLNGDGNVINPTPIDN